MAQVRGFIIGIVACCLASLAAGFLLGRLVSRDSDRALGPSPPAGDPAPHGAAQLAALEPRMEALSEELERLRSERERLAPESARLARELADAEKKATPVDAAAPGNEQASSEGQAARSVLDTDVLRVDPETMEREIAAVREDRWLFTKASGFSLQVPEKWPTEGILSDFEVQYGVELGEEEREKLEATIAIYRHLGEIADTAMSAALGISAIERASSGEFEIAKEDGSFESDPAIDPSEVFTVSLAGGKRFRWSKAKHPEEHRQVVAARYVPIAMLRELQAHFEKRQAGSR